MKIPMWAQDLILRVAIDEGKSDLPSVKWRRKSYGIYVSGTTYTYENRIVLTVGRHADRKEQKVVLLHELAHWLLPKGEHHSASFWDKAFELYRRYDVPMRYAYNREKSYRKEAIKAYRRNVDMLR